MIFGIDIVNILIHGLPMLPSTLINFVPAAFQSVGEWATCIAQNGATSPLCQGM
ncbi:hypothetical protein [Skermania sp. ID1734]|uniref:hypothetical protein n=1 Tax=Skermania sp. ID1734 TaxID=2597516 RepID=UPI00163D5646|nr:hypothetical protein [Skermania sp. ID1734]